MKTMLLRIWLFVVIVYTVTSNIHFVTLANLPDERTKGELYFEYVTSVVVDESENLGTFRCGTYNYDFGIRYSRPYQNGDRIFSVFVYNPFTTYEDDCVRVFDLKVGTGK